MIERATDIEYSQEFSLLKKSLMLWFNMSFSRKRESRRRPCEGRETISNPGLLLPQK